jgi:hypothetical protein
MERMREDGVVVDHPGKEASGVVFVRRMRPLGDVAWPQIVGLQC